MPSPGPILKENDSLAELTPMKRLLCAIILLAPVTSQADAIRIFVTDSNSWESSGGFGASNGTASGHFSGGARPQTAEIIKTFGERCSGTTVTIDKTKAQFIVLLDHEGGKGVVLKDNKIAVFSASGDVVYSGSTRSLGNAVKDACATIFRSNSSPTRASHTNDADAPKDTQTTPYVNGDTKSVPAKSTNPPAKSPAVNSTASTPTAVASGFTNDDILQLKKAGFSDTLLLTRIEREGGPQFKLDSVSLIQLKSAGISEEVIAAMVMKSSAK